VAGEVDARPAQAVLDGQLVVVGALEGLEEGAGAEVGPAGAQDDDAVGLLAQAVGQGDGAAEVAVLAAPAVLVEEVGGQVDEAGVEGLLLRRGVADLAVAGDLAAALEQARG
jgi:hypothetical protein